MSCNSDAPSEDGKLVRVGAVSFSPRLPRPLGLTAIIPSTTVGSWVSKRDSYAPLVALHNAPEVFRDCEGYLGSSTTQLLFAG